MKKKELKDSPGQDSKVAGSSWWFHPTFPLSYHLDLGFELFSLTQEAQALSAEGNITVRKSHGPLSRCRLYIYIFFFRVSIQITKCKVCKYVSFQAPILIREA